MSQCELGTFTFSGIEAVPLHLTARVSPGLRNLNVCGIPDSAARATCGRVLAAINAIRLSLPPTRAHVQLKPAVIAREGPLRPPVALGVLGAMDVLPREKLSWYAAVGG